MAETDDERRQYLLGDESDFTGHHLFIGSYQAWRDQGTDRDIRASFRYILAWDLEWAKEAMIAMHGPDFPPDEGWEFHTQATQIPDHVVIRLGKALSEAPEPDPNA